MQITDLDKSQRQTFINHQKRNPVYKWTTFVTITRTKLYESSCAIPGRHDRLWFNPNFWKSLQPDGHNSYLHVGIRYQPEKGLASCFISLKIMQFSTRGTFPRHQEITNGHWIPGLEKVINRSARVPILLKQSDAIPVCLQRSQKPNRRGRSSQQTEACHTPVPTVFHVVQHKPKDRITTIALLSLKGSHTFVTFLPRAWLFFLYEQMDRFLPVFLRSLRSCLN